MPMPPPKSSTEPGPRRRQRREIEQIVRALRDLGPTDEEALAKAVGATYWEPGRFEQAVAAARAGGQVVVDAEGRHAAV